MRRSDSRRRSRRGVGISSFWSIVSVRLSMHVVKQRPFVEKYTIARMNYERRGRMFDDGRPANLMARLQQIHLVEIGFVPASADIGIAPPLVGRGRISVAERALDQDRLHFLSRGG